VVRNHARLPADYHSLNYYAIAWPTEFSQPTCILGHGMREVNILQYSARSTDSSLNIKKFIDYQVSKHARHLMDCYSVAKEFSEESNI
jgi:hypothetical protein